MTLFVTIISLGVVATMNARGEITDFFPEAKSNLTKISWAHAVNNQSLLNDALHDSVMMLEADIVMGKLINSTSSEEIPIMGHPPANTSDLSLQEFLNKISSYNNNATGSSRKGVKLDFKTIEVFNKSYAMLNTIYPAIDYPLWLNADILPGPVNATTTPVDATQFLYLAKQFKNSTLSIGWTTSYGADFPPSSYTKEQIDEMLETIKTNSITQTVTFPVRAGIAAESLDNMKLLLQNVSDSTLTIWSSEGDNVNVTNLRNLIKSVGLDKVYVDVPADLQGQLHLDTLSSSSLSSFSFLSFVLFIFLFLTRIL